jgi:DNA repair photolyase
MMIEQVKMCREDVHARQLCAWGVVDIRPGENCTFGCKYCYIQEMGYNIMREPKPWPLSGDQIVVALLCNRDFAPGRKGQVARIDYACEPFHPKILKRTLEYIEAISKHLGNPVQIVTKQHIPLELAQKLAAVCASDLDVLVSIATLDNATKLEPNAANSTKRFESIKNLLSVGIPVATYISPLLPGIISYNEVEKIIQLSSQAGAKAVVSSPLLLLRKDNSTMLKRLQASGFDTKEIKSRAVVRKESFWQVDCSDLEKYVRKCATEIGLPYFLDATCFSSYVRR